MKGITITLYDRVKTAVDALNNPVYTETAVSVNNVLVAPVSSTEVLDTYNLTGRKAVYHGSRVVSCCAGWLSSPFREPVSSHRPSPCAHVRSQ